MIRPRDVVALSRFRISSSRVPGTWSSAEGWIALTFPLDVVSETVYTNRPCVFQTDDSTPCSVAAAPSASQNGIMQFSWCMGTVEWVDHVSRRHELDHEFSDKNTVILLKYLGLLFSKLYPYTNSLRNCLSQPAGCNIDKAYSCP